MPVVSAFPRRPLELSSLPSKRFGWLPALGMLLFAFGLIADLLYVVPPLVDDALLGAGGKLAQHATVAPGGRCSISRGVLTDCEFKAVFTPEGAGETHKSVRYFALFQSIDDRIPFRVYYDPSDPQRISTSWGQALLVNRLVSQAVALPFLLAVLTYFPLSYRRSLQLRRSLLAMATAPRAVVAEFIRIRSSRHFATILFAWTDPESGEKRRDSSRLARTAEPFWLDRQRKRLLALAGPDGHAHALDEWLRPAVLTEEERHALGQARSGAGQNVARETANTAAFG